MAYSNEFGELLRWMMSGVCPLFKFKLFTLASRSQLSQSHGTQSSFCRISLEPSDAWQPFSATGQQIMLQPSIPRLVSHDSEIMEVRLTTTAHRAFRAQ